jgi:hypothetical protein
MSPSSLTLIRAAFLDHSEVSLGCLVPNPLEPGQDFCPVKPPVIGEDKINKRYIENVHDLLGADKHIGLRAKITRMFSATARGESRAFNRFVAQRATLYYRTHPSLHFESLCDNDDTKEWIEKVLKRFPIFLVTGFLTMTDAAVDRARQQSGQVRLTAEVSTGDIGSSGVTAVVGEMPDSVGAEVNAGGQFDTHYSFVAPGERIIGVQFRKLIFNRFSSVDIDKTKLKRNTWVMFLGDRHKGTETSIGDILEANLEESLTVDDLELEDQVEREELDARNDEFVFVDE